MSKRVTLGGVALIVVLVPALVVAAAAAQKIIAGQLAGGGGGGAGGGMKLVGSIPASAAGKSSGGAYKLTGGFIAAAQVWREGTLQETAVAKAGSGMVAALAAVPTGKGAQITFSLSAPASVEINVLNIAGRLVRTIATGAQCEKGLNTFVWTGLSNSGLAAPNGRYVIEVRASAATGTQSRAVAACQVAR